MAERVSLTTERLAVVSNPHSRRNRAGLSGFAELCRQEDIMHGIAATGEELEKRLRDYAARGVEALAINGGDGTVDRIITTIRNQNIFTNEPVYILLRGGTTNMIHRDVGLKGRPCRALRKLLDRGSVRIEQRRPLCVRDKLAEKIRYGFFLGTGAVPRVILNTRQTFHHTGMTGKAGEFLSLCRTVSRLLTARGLGTDPDLHPAETHMSDEKGGTQTHQQIFLTVTSLRRLILGIRTLSDDRAAGILGLDLPYSDFGRALPSILRGRYLSGGHDNGIISKRTEALSLDGRFPWVLDGEIYNEDCGPAQLDIKPGSPARFMVI